MTEPNIDESLRRWAEDVRADETTPTYDFRPIALDAWRSRFRRRTMPVLAAAAVAVIATSIAIGTHGPGHTAETTRTASQQPGTPGPSAVQPSASHIPTSGPGCPTTRHYRAGTESVVDYVDFIYYRKHFYTADGTSTAATPEHRAELRPPVTRVSCTISDINGNVHVVGPYHDGNAAFFPVGSPIYAAPGYSSACRLAAVSHGRIRQYLAQRNSEKTATPLPCAVAPRPQPGQ